MALKVNKKIQTELSLICIIYLAIVVWPATAVSDIHFQVLEEQTAGDIVGDISTVWGIAANHGDNVQFLIDDAMSDDRATDLFSIHPTDGVLATAQRLDRDDICKYLDSCTLVLGIGIISSTRYESISVSIEVMDINDNRPVFLVGTESLGIPESTDINTLFALSEAYDPDAGANGLQSYDLRPDSAQFGIITNVNLDGSMDVQLQVLAALDREAQDAYTLYLVASDAGSPALSSSMTLNVTIVDINDNVATFTHDLYEYDVTEDTSVSQVVATVHATDPDMGEAGRVVYELSGRTQALYGDTFTINQHGEIVLAQELDYETTVQYELTVSARDSAPNARNSFTKVIINVLDVNDFAPQISVTSLANSAQAEVVEHAPRDTFVAHVSVVDRDSGASGRVTCVLDNARFRLNTDDVGTQYQLVTAASFDREAMSSDGVSITCEDHGTPPLTTERRIEVAITDINDNSPVFNKSMYSIVLQENNEAGVYVATVTALDADSGVNSEVSYSLEEQVARDGFAISSSGVITALHALDHETQHVVLFHVRAQDGGSPPRSTSTAVQIQVDDINDSPPAFATHTFEFSAAENQGAGVDIGQLVATDADSSPFNVIRYAFQSQAFALRALFDLDRDSGLIRTKAAYDRETKHVYSFHVVAYNPDVPTLNSTASVTVAIDDVNDMAPYFIFPSSDNYTLEISSDLEAGEFVVQARAFDLDTGQNAYLTYSLSAGNDAAVFAISAQTGAITVAKDLSKTNQKNFNLSILVLDHGSPPLSSTETLAIWATGTRPRAAEDEPFPANLIILIILVSVTGLLMILLLVAILWLVYKSRYRKSKHRYRHASEENLGPQVQIIDRLDTLTTADLNASFRDQHLYDLRHKPYKKREGPINSHNSADSGFDEHPEVSQYGRRVSFNVSDKPQAADDKPQGAADKPQGADDSPRQQHPQADDSSSTSSEEGSNTDSGCVLSEGACALNEGACVLSEGACVLNKGSPDPQVPQRTYPTAGKLRPIPPGSSRETKAKHSTPSHNTHTHHQHEYTQPHHNQSVRQPHTKHCAVKLRYVDNEWPDICRSVDVDNCVKNGVMRNFADCNSIMRYKVKQPSATKCTSEYTDNTSSTSGSYVLTMDEHGATAC